MKKLAFVFAIAALLVGCNSVTKENSIAMVNTEHTAQNSLDWAGVYEGILPCADCEGIKTTLTLNYDGTFVLQRAYLKGKMTYLPPAETGTIAWDKNRPSVIYLTSKQDQTVFFVGEGFVTLYDIEGQPIEGPLDFNLQQITVFH